MVHALAMAADELADETALIRQLLDEFDRCPTEVEVLPDETAAGLFARLLVMPRVGREIAPEESDATVDGFYGNRNMVEADSYTFNQGHRSNTLPSMQNTAAASRPQT